MKERTVRKLNITEKSFIKAIEAQVVCWLREPDDSPNQNKQYANDAYNIIRLIERGDNGMVR